jgi:hypothetical protein
MQVIDKYYPPALFVTFQCVRNSGKSCRRVGKIDARWNKMCDGAQRHHSRRGARRRPPCFVASFGRPSKAFLS